MKSLRLLLVVLAASLGFGILANGAAAQSAESHTLEVRAKGESGAEKIRLVVGSETIASFDLSSDWATYSATVDTPTSTSDIAVVYNNDESSDDRSILVDHIIVDGTIHQTEAPGVLSSGSFNPRSDCKDGYNETEELSCSGRLVYDAPLGLSAVSSDQTPNAGETWLTHCGPISADEVWSADIVHVVSCPVTVDSASLVIEPGAIVKFEPQAHGAGIILEEGASLNADGTSNAPIIFTSNYDDARGGDTNGHRSSSTLRSGRYGTPITVSPGSKANLDNVLIDYASVGVGDIGSSSTDPAVVIITASTIQNSFYLGVNFDEPQTEASVNRTVFESNRIGAARFADKASISGFGVNGQHGNYFQGTPAARQIYLADVDIPADESWTFGPSRDALLTLENEKSLNVDGRLNFEGGSIIKIHTAGVESAITARTGSTVNFWGRADSPITITSVLDDTAGGDTNFDGAASTPRWNSYNTAIRIQAGSTVAVDYTIVKYGRNGIAGERSDSEDLARLRVSNSTFADNLYFGIHVNKAPIDAQINTNLFRDNGLGGVRFTTGNSPEKFYTEGGAGNRFEGLDSGRQVWLGTTKLPENRTFVFSPDGNAVLTLENARSLNVEGTVVIQAGSIVKVNSNARKAGLHIADGGQAFLNGTRSNPIIVTAAVDDTYGGDSNGDGDGAPEDNAQPRLGNYRSFAWLSPGATFHATHTEIAYARNAIIDVKGDSENTTTLFVKNTTIRDTLASAIDFKRATTNASFESVTIDNARNGIKVKNATIRFRGTFLNTDMDIRACNFGGSCSVDAQNVTWGNPAADGPFLSDGTPTVCGNVVVSHWTDQSAEDSDTHYTGTNCNGSSF